jgi:hypothetical protein
LESGGLLKRGQAITLEAERDTAEGEVVTTDFNPAKLDGEVLLDYGVWDAASVQVGSELACQNERGKGRARVPG